MDYLIMANDKSLLNKTKCIYKSNLSHSSLHCFEPLKMCFVVASSHSEG